MGKQELWLKPEKCEFSRKEVKYLGLIIARNQIWMDPTKVAAVTDWLAPQNVMELQQLIGFSNFYCRYINHFLGKAQPLHDLRKAKTPFLWTGRFEAAFQALKKVFTMAPILKIADPYREFIL